MGARRLALAALLVCSAALAHAEPALSLREVAPGVHVHVGIVDEWGPANGGDVGNVGVVVGERCAAVIDSSGTAALGAALKAAVRRITPLPVCWLINTHAHPDHVLGNEAFVEADGSGPRIVGHHRLPAALQARAPHYLNALRRDFGTAHADTRIVAPTVLVQDTLELDLGGRTLLLRAWPTAHTDADLTVLDTRSGTLFLGDLLFRDHMPVVDGRLKGWLAVLERLAAERVALAVPGHGEPSSDWPGVLAPQQRYLTELQASVRTALKAGWTLLQATERIAPPPAPWRLGEVYHARNVTAAYAELEWED